MKSEQNIASEQKYRKEQLLRNWVLNNKDAASAVLRDDREYTVDEAVKAVQRFMERQVK